jgi:hypothetical protein
MKMMKPVLLAGAVAALGFADGSYDQVIIFFLLHAFEHDVLDALS